MGPGRNLTTEHQAKLGLRLAGKDRAARPRGGRERNKYILVDRDGVINEAVRDGYITSPDMLRLLPGAAEAIAALNRHGFEVLVISNQQCVGKGIITTDELDRITQRLCELVGEAGGRIQDVFYCPHLASEGCGCRKPKPGLILQAQERYGFDPAETYFIGDSFADIETAQRAGCPAVFVLSGLDAGRHHAGEPFPRPPERVADDLADAVAFVIDQTCASERP